MIFNNSDGNLMLYTLTLAFHTSNALLIVLSCLLFSTFVVEGCAYLHCLITHMILVRLQILKQTESTLQDHFMGSPL